MSVQPVNTATVQDSTSCLPDTDFPVLHTHSLLYVIAVGVA